MTNSTETKFFRVTLSGYGGESVYASLTKEEFDFWNEHCEEHGDGDLVNYMLGSDEDEFDFEDIDELPEEAKFLKGDAWYDAPTEFEHENTVSEDYAWINVDEVDSGEYDAENLDRIVISESVGEYTSTIEEESDYEVSILQYEDSEMPEAEYIVQMVSSEKGCFFDGIIETTGDFDPKKLRIYSKEFPNGEDMITGVEYEGEMLDNVGGDTTGKGYSAAVWEA